jgi:hypothetical protein
VASFHFKVLASSLTKNKNKRVASGVTTKYLLQFSCVTFQQGAPVSLISTLSEPISVFPHSKYLKGTFHARFFDS